jgi:hypothetical protein
MALKHFGLEKKSLTWSSTRHFIPQQNTIQLLLASNKEVQQVKCNSIFNANYTTPI